jgi:hypothetical protein
MIKIRRIKCNKKDLGLIKIWKNNKKKTISNNLQILIV